MVCFRNKLFNYRAIRIANIYGWNVLNVSDAFHISTNALTFPSRVAWMSMESIKFNEFSFIIILISISQKARERIHKNAVKSECVLSPVSCEFFTTLSSTFITFILISACMSFYDTLIIIFHVVLSDGDIWNVHSALNLRTFFESCQKLHKTLQ